MLICIQSTVRESSDYFCTDPPIKKDGGKFKLQLLERQFLHEKAFYMCNFSDNLQTLRFDD